MSFLPLVGKDLTMGRKIERVRYLRDLNKVELQWRDSFLEAEFKSAAYDFAIITPPFSVVRKWRLPHLSTTMTNAVNKLSYNGACKVALEFSTRFWEHYANPILGGCSTTSDIPGIGTICYPSYNLNGSGPASILASYISGDWGFRWVSTPEAEHIKYVLDAMVEIHGDDIRQLFTGKYTRQCWLLDEYTSGSWAFPSVGQHQLYLPEYFKTHNNVSARHFEGVFLASPANRPSNPR